VRVLVLGATGRVGRQVLDRARARGHDVGALLRSPEKLGDLATQIAVTQGDVLDAGRVAAAVAGHDAVVYAIGAGHVRTTTLFSRSTAIVLEAMRQARVRRLICVTGVGAGDTRGHGGFVYDRIVFPLFTRGLYADKDRQEAMIAASDLDWTIVRPAPFSDAPAAELLQVVTRVAPGMVLSTIAPAEVATFIIDELEQNRYHRQAVFIGHRR
jgi:putative NADH-flavin reductase